MLSSHSKLYRRVSPDVQEHLLAVTTRLRGLVTDQRELRRITARIEASQWLSRAEWEALQLETMRALALDAGHRVPYYREQFGRLGIDPTRWQCLADLAEITPETVEELDPVDFVAVSKVVGDFMDEAEG